ncbi:hypothetical protein BV25DRAFT_1242820 [Artomyces pyxidatus]|uniref:Uncharacterized protein n=1 Tax=Artomyces pyxidatus TaxID=48021 RepID=A0ACB8TEH0_9AGAM|nr:hypothetical protein BV25DRAFT_1242820 [Artomyces pyxidatus]
MLSRVSFLSSTGRCFLLDQNQSTKGELHLCRTQAEFLHQIDKQGPFAPEPGRYHLYASSSCPWANQCLIVHKLKGLDDIISVSIASPRLTKEGWAFASVDAFPGTDPDPLYNSRYIKDLYHRSHPKFQGRCTVPLLWDKRTQSVVNNDADDIMKIFNFAFNDFLPPHYASANLYPTHLRHEIRRIADWVNESITKAIFKAGFAVSSTVYCSAVIPLFEALDQLEGMLAGKDYLVGNQLTQSDIILYVNMIRFDPIYYHHFKCNMRMIRTGYPNIHTWLRKLYWRIPAFQLTTDFNHIKSGFYLSYDPINNSGIVPMGPVPHIEPL